MARIRSIKPEILTDERTAGRTDAAWRLFVSMITLADDQGNLHANPDLLSAEVFWARGEPRDVRSLLTELEVAGLIRFYRVRGQSYVQLLGWSKHQKVDHPGRPIVPGPEQADQDQTGKTKEEQHTRRAMDSRDPRETLAPDQDQDQDQETVGRREDSSSSSAAPVRRATAELVSKSLLTFPVVRGKRTGALEFHLTEAELAVLRDGFPDLDALAEARKARAWILANTHRRKTAGGMMQFLVGWLGRAQNRGFARPGTPAANPQAQATQPGLCVFHLRAENANRPARSRDPLCSECRHVAALTRRAGCTEPVDIGAIAVADQLPEWAK